jgi:hypothetical protein
MADEILMAKASTSEDQLDQMETSDNVKLSELLLLTVDIKLTQNSLFTITSIGNCSWNYSMSISSGHSVNMKLKYQNVLMN